jgi:KaiC/GvpD/RAD55 family RecA-like ATPase
VTGYRRAEDKAADAALALLRLLWRQRLRGAAPATAGGRVPPELGSELRDELRDADPDLPERTLAAWTGYVCNLKPEGPGQLETFEHVYNATQPWSSYFEAAPHDIRYSAMRAIRYRYGLTLSSTVVAGIHQLAKAIRTLLARKQSTPIADYSRLTEQLVLHLASLLPPDQASGGTTQVLDTSRNIVRAFYEVCLVLDLVHEEGGLFSIRSECGNPEYLMSHLFGVPTSIAGFDTLFGGGGLMLVDSASDGTQDTLGGRAILASGPLGSGKTLLALQFAFEVAKKGGVAWVIAMEQTAEECRYSLEAIGIPTRSPAFDVMTEFTDSFQAMFDARPDRGVVVFLRVNNDKVSYSEFLGRIRARLAWMERYPLRLLVVDPVNAFELTDDRALRQETRSTLDAARRQNVNVWFTSEERGPAFDMRRFEANVSDTIIQLRVDAAHGQQRRFIKIRKSRYQQEFSGNHALVIDSLDGLQVYPSSQVIKHLIAAKPSRRPNWRVDFGVEGMDSLLGDDGLRPGDIAVFAGPGKAKTLLGFQFISAPCNDPARISLYVSDYSHERMNRFLEGLPNRGDMSRHIETCSLETGYVEPSKILLTIQGALESCIRRGLHPERVLLTNTARWEKEMPLLATDHSFASALLAILRHFGVVAVIVAGDITGAGASALGAAFDAQSDCLLHFNRVGLKGATTTFVSAVKSRLMRHRSDAFELVIGPTAVKVQPAPLFRVSPDGDVRPVRVHLFLNAETEDHLAENDKLVTTLRASVAPDARLGTESRRYDPMLLGMAPFSAVDEMQVLQLDEFQLPTAAAAIAGVEMLWRFDVNRYQRALEGRLPFLRNRVLTNDRKSFVAVPYYANISFLVVDEDRLNIALKELNVERPPASWHELADLCDAWENAGKQGPFFLCPVYGESVETYNCLFFEILYTLREPNQEEIDDIAKWLEPQEARIAAGLFRRVCKRSRDRHSGTGQSRFGVVSRHWYNTLNQAISELTPKQRQQFTVQPLYGSRTTAGEWYLTVPAHSASPEVALKLIEVLTEPDRETQRVELGVGLPTRAAYYDEPEAASASVSRYFDFKRSDLKPLFDRAIKRSSFRLYQQFAPTFSSHLRWIIDIADPPLGSEAKNYVDAEIERKLHSLVANIRFLRKSAGSSG